VVAETIEFLSGAGRTPPPHNCMLVRSTNLRFKLILMKKILIYTLLVFSFGCKKDNYPGGTIAPYIALYDVRNIYKGQDVTLTTDNMFGSDKLAVMVVSDHSGGNLPEGLLVVQDARRLSKLRGISIPLGANAADYVPGDSLIINAEGKVLTTIDGILQLKGVTTADITKVSSGNAIPLNRVSVNLILNNPGDYESTLAVVVKGGFDPLPAPTDVLAGDKMLNDGFGYIHLYTDPAAEFANDIAHVNGNYYGIVFNTIKGEPQLRLRKANDVTVLGSTIEVTPAVITGFMSDVKGGDGNYEYIQMMATRDIDFSVTPFALVVTNNANASTPTGYPAKGWATGNMRTYKFSLSSGFAAKGTFFYVGGAGKMINGASSTNMSSSNWIRAFDYTLSDGDGFGTKTTGLLANSGNAFGMALFQDSTVTVDSKPFDVIFISTGGSLYSAGKGYRIANTDFYDVIDPITLKEQPFYRMGSNTMSLVYNTADVGYFNMLGGEYSPALGKWVKARIQNNVILSKTSALTEIEGEGATMLK
jgi:hypothetical protein